MDEHKNFWPAYATNLAFELVKVKQENAMDSYIIRIILNGSPIKVISQEDESELSMTDFLNIVDGLTENSLLKAKDDFNTVDKLKREDRRWRGEVRRRLYHNNGTY